MIEARSRSRRKRHVQQELFKTGGKCQRKTAKRKKAGRKPKGRRVGSRHKERPEVKPRDALHIVLRAVPATGSLRRRDMYKGVERNRTPS
jgi:hypothetical protein